MMQNGRIKTPPSLDLACPQAEAEIENHVHMFRDRGVAKIKDGHECIMTIFRTTTYCYITSDAKVIIRSQGKV